MFAKYSANVAYEDEGRKVGEFMSLSGLPIDTFKYQMINNDPARFTYFSGLEEMYRLDNDKKFNTSLSEIRNCAVSSVVKVNQYRKQGIQIEMDRSEENKENSSSIPTLEELCYKVLLKNGYPQAFVSFSNIKCSDTRMRFSTLIKK